MPAGMPHVPQHGAFQTSGVLIEVLPAIHHMPAGPGKSVDEHRQPLPPGRQHRFVASAAKASGEPLDVQPGVCHAGCRGVPQVPGQFNDALSLRPDQRGGSGENWRPGEHGDMTPPSIDQLPRQQVQPPFVMIHLLVHLPGVRDKPHGRLRRRRGTNVSDKFDHGRIRFVTDRRNNGCSACIGRIRNDLLVERPEVFHGSPAACDENGVNAQPLVMLVHPADGPGDLLGRAVALHLDIDDKQGNRAAAMLGGVDHVMNGRSACRGNDRDPPGKDRRFDFVGRVEVPLGAQFLAHGPEPEFQRPGSDRLKLANVKLGLALRAVVADLAGGDDFVAVIRGEAEFLHRGRPRDAAQHRLVILEREVPVVAAVEIADLADHPYRGSDMGFERGFDQGSGLRHGQLLRFGSVGVPLLSRGFAGTGAAAGLCRFAAGHPVRIEWESGHHRP